MTTLTILHTNDFHNHLKPDQASRIAAAKADHPGALLLDAGDAVSAGNVGVRPGGEPILTMMSDLGYRAMTMGNREFHIADALLRYKIADARFPILCANMRWRDAVPGAMVAARGNDAADEAGAPDKSDRGTGVPACSGSDNTEHGSRPVPTRPYVLLETLGLKVAVIGVTVPMVTARMSARFISAFLFDDPVDCVQRLAARLRPQVDVLIALTHIGSREDQRLARTCPDLDLVIGGHSHDVLPEPVFHGDVPIVQAGWHGRYLGVLDLHVENGTAMRKEMRGRLVALKD
jgi:2',3'-cyclic-nucleotide 2'-phosphodiesterase (5'-nucleotidase family)